MALAGTVYECSIASRRLAEAQSISELEQEWHAAQEKFQSAWERTSHNKSHKLVMIVHDGYGAIGDNDVAEALSTINLLDEDEPVDVILHTHGGFVAPTIQIAEVLVHRPQTSSFVPMFAHSGGTLIALATQKIHLAKGAALGPVDLQVDMESYSGSARQFIEIVNNMGDEADVAMKVVAKEIGARVEHYAKEVCGVTNRKHKGILGWRGCELANNLTKGDMMHSQGINLAMARRLHMNVREDVPKAVYALINVRLTQLRRLRELQRKAH